jgi:ATP-dependent Clp endopeptidase proteolytic subunit ClpP
MTTPTIARDRLRGVARNSRREWFNIRRDPGSNVATVRIYAEIGDSWWGDSVSAADFARDLDQLDVETINLHINSPGGDVFDGIAIANVIRQHPARVVAVVDGLAASAASFIAAAADELEMARNSELMIHDAWGLVVGNSSDVRALADRLDQMSDNIAGIYAEKAGGELAEWRDLMRAETWFSADEAVTAGLADRVSKAATEDKAKAQFDLSIFNHAGRAHAPHPVIPGRHRAALHTPPPAPESTAHLQEGSTVTDSLATAIRERLGITDADLDEGGILAALDEALAEQADPPPTPTSTLRVGVVMVDEPTLNELRADALAGREARARQVQDDQARLVNSAVEDGRIAPARRDHWVAALRADPDVAEVLAALPPILPLQAAGYTGGVEEAPDDDRVYAMAWPTTPGKVG